MTTTKDNWFVEPKDPISQSLIIYNRAYFEFQPKLVVLMFSGGKDSLATYYLAKELNIKIDYILHGITGTGIPETRSYCQQFAEAEGMAYLEADAGTAYEDYVLRKGFFGIGNTAHSYAYHILKAANFRKAIARLRMRRRNFNVLMLNGARVEESINRAGKINQTWNIDPGAKTNIWVNILLHWTRAQRDDFLESCKARINPVVERLCRSGECLCGTTQSNFERQEAAFWYPEWGAWLKRLERKVRDNGFNWGWGEHMPNDSRKSKSVFQPACHSCQLRLFDDQDER